MEYSGIRDLDTNDLVKGSGEYMTSFIKSLERFVYDVSMSIVNPQDDRGMELIVSRDFYEHYIDCNSESKNWKMPNGVNFKIKIKD